MNLWLERLLEWGQAAIDEQPILIDAHGARQHLFVALEESLRAKEHDENKVQLKTWTPEAKDDLIIVPLSGGIDSLVTYYRAVEAASTVETYYVRLNTPYAEQELAAIKRVGLEPKVIDLRAWPARWEPYKTEWKHILPLRNLVIIVAIATWEWERPAKIWLGATKGEIPDLGGDKSVRFFDYVDSVLDTFPVKHTLEFPLRNETKTDIVKWWVTKGWDTNVLLSTITCQDPVGDVPCGACHACFNRWVALTNNGLDERMLTNPLTVPQNVAKIEMMRRALNLQDFSVWSEHRILQTLNAWDRMLSSGIR